MVRVNWSVRSKRSIGVSLNTAEDCRHRIEFAAGFRKRLIRTAPVDSNAVLKDRRLGQCKMWIRQVLISRTLSACGEVAERLKAAVC